MLGSFGFRWEPALISEAIRQVLLVLVLLGALQLNDQQTAGIIMAVSAILALFTRASVVSQTTLEQAGTDKQTIVATAAANATTK
jgi:hypothetical protein